MDLSKRLTDHGLAAPVAWDNLLDAGVNLLGAGRDDLLGLSNRHRPPRPYRSSVVDSRVADAGLAISS